VVPARDDAQEAGFRALFDREDQYGELLQLVKEARATVGKSTEAQARKRLRDLEAQLAAIVRTDFFPGAPNANAVAALAALRRDVEAHLSPGEPQCSRAVIEARAVADYQARVWATRRRPWVDRLGTAWLVQRFIDKAPTFLWLADPASCPPDALGYDFDQATFTHVDDKVTFEVVAESFGLLADPALNRLAALVHFIDVGGIPVDEAPGFEMLVRGLLARHPDDDALLAAAIPLFDMAYAAFQVHQDA